MHKICPFLGMRLGTGKMVADEYHDSDQFSDDDVYDNLGENYFDLFELTEEEESRACKCS